MKGLNDEVVTKRCLVVYDSQTGNTEKVAREIATALNAELKRIETVNDVSGYDLVVFGSPNIKAKPTEKFQAFLATKPQVDNYAVFITSGMPLWAIISGRLCFHYFAKQIGKKPVATINVKGYHAKAKTYRGHPNQQDLLSAHLFGIKALKRVGNISKN